jgi:hypothetical protein
MTPVESFLGTRPNKSLGYTAHEGFERDFASFDGEPERIRQRQMCSLRRATDKPDLAQLD